MSVRGGKKENTGLLPTWKTIRAYLGVAKDPLPGIDMIVLVLDRNLLGHEGVEGGAALGRLAARPLDQLGRLRIPGLQRVLKKKNIVKVVLSSFQAVMRIRSIFDRIHKN